jgi:hypothetical protein
MPAQLDPDFERRTREDFGKQGFMRSLGVTMELLELGFCELHLPFRARAAARVFPWCRDRSNGRRRNRLRCLFAAAGGPYECHGGLKLNLLAPAVGEQGDTEARISSSSAFAAL